MNSPEYEDGEWASGWEDRCGTLQAHKDRIAYLENSLLPTRTGFEIIQILNRLKHPHIRYTAKMGLRKEAEEQRLLDIDIALSLLRDFYGS